MKLYTSKDVYDDLHLYIYNKRKVQPLNLKFTIVQEINNNNCIGPTILLGFTGMPFAKLQ